MGDVTSQEEVDQLVAARSETAGSGGIWGGDGGTEDNGSLIFEGEHGTVNGSMEAMSEGETDGV